VVARARLCCFYFEVGRLAFTWEGKKGRKRQSTPERRVFPKIGEKLERRVNLDRGSTYLHNIY
jgi:hypothetical protein